jgi:hypothetical protein
MSDLVAALFEQELKRRGVPCLFDGEAQRYRVQHQGREFSRLPLSLGEPRSGPSRPCR